MCSQHILNNKDHFMMSKITWWMVVGDIKHQPEQIPNLQVLKYKK